MQRRLDKAVADGDKRKIRYFTYLLTRRSQAVRILAVHRVTVQNEGKKTPGVDGMRILDDRVQEACHNNQRVRQQLLSVNVRKKPQPIRRTYIKKPNGGLRALGIPTLTDRVIQDIIRQATEPITEYHMNDCSYGFRPKRSCHDAIEAIFNKMSRRDRPQWVIEGDIKSCFDNIKHEHITNTLKQWRVPTNIVEIISRMLKAGIFSGETLIEPETGTPQGGILSPMLANVALTDLDDFCEKEYGKRGSNPIVRYADDFIVVCKDREEAEQRRGEIANRLREVASLTLSYEKSTITNIHDGVNFLGFNLRKYRDKSDKGKYHKVGKLLIKPQKEKVIKYLHRIKQELNTMKTATQEQAIRKLNPIIRGFALYYRHAVSKEMYQITDHRIWYKLWRWALRRHHNKDIRWVKKKYFRRNKTRDWIFSDGTNRIFEAAYIPIVRYVKVASGKRAHGYLEETREYWECREFTQTLSKIYTVQLAKLYRKQKGKCAYCGYLITMKDIIGEETHTHHMLPLSEGGDNKSRNLRLLHDACHKELHSTMSRDWMAREAKAGIDYIQCYVNKIDASISIDGSESRIR
jgi:RNA-directed DNA polymerase